MFNNYLQGSGQISAGTNETFASLPEGDYVVSIRAKNWFSFTGANGDILSLTGTNSNGCIYIRWFTNR